jgi:flagellar basal-body rod modification protein FlgD
MTDAITSSGTVFGAGGTSNSVERIDAGGSMGEDTFLKLLMAQMTHQDPMQPTDSAQMLSQLAQFANVEGINKLNKQTTSLNLGQDFAGSVAMIGKTVTWLDSEGAAHTGVVDAVKPSPSGALLVIDAEEVPSGAVRKVE